MSDVILDKTALDAAIGYGKTLASPAFVGQEPVHFAAATTPNGEIKIVSLKEYQFPHGMPPERIKASPAFQNSASFCAYLKAYKSDDLRIFADSNRSSFEAILDYHPTNGEPTFCQHRATWQLLTSTSWNVWHGSNEKWIKQGEFADFIEDQYKEIIEPSHAWMYDVARELIANSEVSFESKINRNNGTAHLRWTEDMKTSGNTEVPERFRISIPVYFGEAPIQIDCILRFKVDQGKLSFLYKMFRPVETRLEAFKTAVGGVVENIGTEVHLGISGSL